MPCIFRLMFRWGGFVFEKTKVGYLLKKKQIKILEKVLCWKYLDI